MIMPSSGKTISVVVSLVCVFASCSSKKAEVTCCQVREVIGKTNLILPSRDTMDAAPGMMVPLQARISVSPSSRILLESNGQKSIAASENTVVSFDSILEIQARRSLFLSLFEGELYCSVRAHIIVPNDSFPLWIRSDDSGSFFIVQAYKAMRTSIIKVFVGNVSVLDRNGQATTVSACSRLLVKGGAGPGKSLQLGNTDFEEISRVLGKSAADSIKLSTVCLRESHVHPNFPPQWEKPPRISCMAGINFYDTLSASDPENAPVTFSLLSAPAGMSIDRKFGIIRFLPKRPGTYNIQVEATDSSNFSSKMAYDLTVTASSPKTVTERPNIVVNMPKAVAPGEQFVMDASQSAPQKDSLKNLSFRFDANGDGSWDYPTGGAFGKASSATHSYQAEGVYTVHVQAKNAQGLVAEAKSTIMVRVLPIAKISVVPQNPIVNKECVLDADKSTVSNAGLPYIVRWDFDNNGAWDYPANGSYSAEKSVKKIWSAPGRYSVVLEIKDNYGISAFTSSEIEVLPEMSISSLSLPDSTWAGSVLNAKCITTIPLSSQPKFEWNFNGTGNFEGKSTNPVAQHTYFEPGTYAVQCRATTSNGLSVIGKHTIVVLLKPTNISAGGPYQAHVNSPITLVGTVKDPENRIVGFDWDFDGNGAFDWSSTTTGKTQHTYTKPGTYNAVFRVTTNDKKEWFDTAVLSIVNNFPKAHAGKPILSKKGRGVRLKGRGEDIDGRIALYEWDFNGDGAFDWSSQKNGEVEHAFDTYSLPVLRVTDDNGATGTETLRVVICPDEMVSATGPFCIDKYEWPNISGKEPEREMTYFEAQKKCNESGKRLCTDKEWEEACSGEHKQKYPSGNSPAIQTCNVVGNRYYKNKVAPSGSFVDCKSPFGAYDMNGNVAEWTQSGGSDSAFVYGGSWHHDLDYTTCSSKIMLMKNKGYFFVGFRCCK